MSFLKSSDPVDELVRICEEIYSRNPKPELQMTHTKTYRRYWMQSGEKKRGDFNRVSLLVGTNFLEKIKSESEGDVYDKCVSVLESYNYALKRKASRDETGVLISEFFRAGTEEDKNKLLLVFLDICIQAGCDGLKEVRKEVRTKLAATTAIQKMSDYFPPEATSQLTGLIQLFMQNESGMSLDTITDLMDKSGLDHEVKDKMLVAVRIFKKGADLDPMSQEFTDNAVELLDILPEEVRKNIVTSVNKRYGEEN